MGGCGASDDDDDDYATALADGLPLVASDALSDRWMPTLCEWHALLMQTKRRPPPDDGAHVDTPCLEWRGARQITYRARRWTPARLFYLLTHGHEPPARTPVVAGCGRSGCVAHVVVDRWRPPRKQRTLDVAMNRRHCTEKTLDESSSAVDGSVFALPLAERERRAQLIWDEMHAELAHLDAIGAPPGRAVDIDPEDLARIEASALADSAVHCGGGDGGGKRRRTGGGGGGGASPPSLSSDDV